MSRRRRGLTAGTGLVLGAAAVTGNWWLIGVGLVLGAAAEGIVARRQR